MMKKISKLLSLIAMLMTIVVSANAEQIEKPVPSDCQLESGMNYYLYLPEQEKYFYVEGLEPSLTEEGSVILFEKTNDGEWTLKGPNGYLYVGFDYVGCDAYEADLGAKWYVEKQVNGAYYLRPSKTDPNLPWSDYPDMWMGFSSETSLIAPVLKADQGFIDWYPVAEANYPAFNSKCNLYDIIIEMQGYGADVSSLITVYNTATDKETIDAAIASVFEQLDQLRFEHASYEKPYDATARYMTNYDLTAGTEGWTMQPGSFLSQREVDWMEVHSFYDDNMALESGWLTAMGDVKLLQPLNNLAPGKYRFSNYGEWVRTDESDGEPARGVYLYAKVGNNIYKEEVSGYGWYTALSQMEFECRSGEAEVGIMFEDTNVGYCLVLDFKLEYLGDDPVTERLVTLIANSQNLIEENAIYSGYSDLLLADIATANELLASGDTEAQEAHFTSFLAHYDNAVMNKKAYIALAQLLHEAMITMMSGDSDAIFDLADYIDENELEEKVESHEYDNEELEEIMKTLAELLEKAKNSIIVAGSDVTNLLVNGHFDSSGGWTATKGTFSIDKNLKIMSQWWTDWSAEQVLTNVPNGTYRMQVQGFYWASWDWGQSESDWLASDQTPTALSNTKIRLNDNESLVQNVWACGPTDIKEGYQGTTYYVPNSEATARLFFDQGLYENTVETTVTDNTLKVAFDCSVAGFWNCFSNLRLTYVGADVNAAKEGLETLIAQAEDYLLYTMSGSVRQALETAKVEAEAVVADEEATFDRVNRASKALRNIFIKADASIKDYERLAAALKLAHDALQDESILNTEAGQELKALYLNTLADYNSNYPSLDAEGVAEVISKIEELIVKAKQGAGFNDGDDITMLITNPSFEITTGNDETASTNQSVHSIPYGWKMNVEGRECTTADDVANGGVNSWTAIEHNDYTTNGEYSYCMLSAPQPDCYLYQDIKGLPAGTYRVTVDMAVHYDGGCSRLTGQRLLVNNVAEYYGKPEYYYQEELDKLHPEETARTFAGYDEVNSNETGDAKDMGNMQTLSVEVTIAEGESLTLGVRTDNNKVAMNRDYENNGWDCCGRYKIDNFRLYCIALGANGIATVEDAVSKTANVYNMMGVKVGKNSLRSKGLYIVGGKKVIVK